MLNKPPQGVICWTSSRLAASRHLLPQMTDRTRMLAVSWIARKPRCALSAVLIADFLAAAPCAQPRRDRHRKNLGRSRGYLTEKEVDRLIEAARKRGRSRDSARIRVEKRAPGGGKRRGGILQGLLSATGI